MSFFEEWRRKALKEEKLRKIIKIVFDDKIQKDEIAQACFMFYRSLGRSTSTIFPDIQTVAEMIFTDKGYKLVHIPLKNEEIGAFQLRLNGYNYLVLNTSKTCAYNNYSVAHELYHILIQKGALNSLDIFKEEYREDENELMANAFAGNILMPEEDFKTTSSQLSKTILPKDKGGIEYFEEYFWITMLMNYYRTTYMSVVVRCFELHIFDIKNDALVTNLLAHNNKEYLFDLCNRYSTLFKNSSIANVSNLDDFNLIYEEAKKMGQEKIQRGIMSEEDLKYRLEGMKKAYLEVVKNKCQ